MHLQSLPLPECAMGGPRRVRDTESYIHAIDLQCCRACPSKRMECRSCQGPVKVVAERTGTKATRNKGPYSTCDG